jgi:hypothetical protein
MLIIRRGRLILRQPFIRLLSTENNEKTEEPPKQTSRQNFNRPYKKPEFLADDYDHLSVEKKAKDG